MWVKNFQKRGETVGMSVVRLRTAVQKFATEVAG
jgi:hypothetical protein